MNVDAVPRRRQYIQSYPLRWFPDLLSVRADGFAEWYNTEHAHSGIKYAALNQRHYGQADVVCVCPIRQQT